MKRSPTRNPEGPTHSPRRLSPAAVCKAGLFVLTALLATEAAAQSVRGRLVFPNGVPLAGASVRLCAPDFCTPPAISGPDGMYYLYQVPPGRSYSLELFLGPGPARKSVPVLVQPGWTDVPPVTL